VADFEAMTAPDFWETGASGRRYSRAHVLDVLEELYREPPNGAGEWKILYHQGTPVREQ
jgi:hypothetical protein